MKSGSIWSIALAAALTVACGADNRDTDLNDNTVGDATATRPADNTAGTAGADASMPSLPGTDKSFVEHMSADGIAEVRLGQLAAQRASNAEVKKFAQRMVADHSKANDELKPIAAKLNAELPTAMDDEHQDLHDKLSKMSGAEFDREYMNAMVEGHEDVANQLERKANDRVGDRGVGTTGTAKGAAADTDAAVTAWASKTLPAVRQHLESAKQIQQKLGDR